MPTHILARRPASTVADGLTTQTDLGAPDLARTQQQYDAYLDALRGCGLEIAILPADERFPDGHFIEDTAVLFGELAFLCRAGAPSREGEADTVVPAIRDHQWVRMTGDDARLEGGDVLFCADRVLIGLSSRTNRAGAEQLRSALRDYQADLRVELVPVHGVLHLKTGLTELAPGVMLAAPTAHLDADLSFAEVITLPPAEAYAANVLPINDTLLIPAGYPTVAALAERHARRVVALEMSEFARMDGGLTCLSLRY